MNAVLVNGNAAGDTLYYGAGAGALPSASAVVADLIDIARNMPRMPSLSAAHERRILPIEDIECGFYLKVPALDKPGVFAKVATILSDRKISIEAAIQKEQAIHTESQDVWVPIVFLTQRVRESVMNQALEAVQDLPEVIGDITRLRIEHFADA
jgi:homoserine dehydrogenase